MTKIIGGTILDTNLAPIQSCPVEIELIQAQGFVIVGKYSLTPKLVVQTGTAGTWTAVVTENDAITPSGTLYRVTEKIPSAHGGSKSYTIQVLTSLGGGTNQVLDLIVPSLGSVGTVNNYITKAYADSVYATLGTPGSAGPTGPTGPAGGAGAAGYLAVSNRAALDALTPVSGLLVLQTDRMIYWTWNGAKYVPVNDPVFTSTGQRDTNFTGPSIGDSYYLDTNNATEGPYWRNHGGQYRLPWNLPWGLVTGGEETFTASSATIAGTEADVTVSAVVVDISFVHVANRSLRIVWEGLVQSSVANDVSVWKITDGSNNQFAQDTVHHPVANASKHVRIVFRVTATGSTQTFKLRAIRAIGSGNIQTVAGGTFPNYFSAEDIGPAGAPA